MLHAFLLAQIVNAWDVVIVDWLIFVTVQPSFAILPGTAGSPGYGDYGFHFWASYLNPTPWIGTVVGALIVGALATWLARRGGQV